MKLFPQQREHLARAALHDGLVLSWKTGRGKTIGGLLWALLKVGWQKKAEGERRKAKAQGSGRFASHSTLQPSAFSLQPLLPVLIVGPSDGFEHWRKEAAQLGIELKSLDSKETLERESRKQKAESRNDGLQPSAFSLQPSFYYTSYTQLTRNGVETFPDYPEFAALARRGEFGSALQRKAEGERLKAETEAFIYITGEESSTLRDAWLAAQENVGEHRVSKAEGQRLNAEVEETGTVFDMEELENNNEHVKEYTSAFSLQPSALLIHCVYSPSLSDLLNTSALSIQPLAFPCVLIDEGVHMKGADTVIGRGIRQLTPRYRLVLTATPVKNRLPDIFHLAGWAAGVDSEPNARWPYAAGWMGAGGPKEQNRFAESFLHVERNLTKERIAEAQTGTKRRFKKFSSEVCNVHGLWKLFAPVVLRWSDPLPQPMRTHFIRVPLGKRQAEVYKYHLDAPYRDKNGKPAHGAKLQALRVAAAAPESALLKEVRMQNNEEYSTIKRLWNEQNYEPRNLR